MKITDVIKRWQKDYDNLKPHQILKKNTLRKKIAAMKEGERDITITPENGRRSSGSENIASNNYTSYASQVRGVYDMYAAKTSYGGELLGGLVYLRVAFLGGEGISFQAEKPATAKFIESLIKVNRLNGMNHINIVKMEEMEGQALLLARPIQNDLAWVNDGKPYVGIHPVLWANTNYTAVISKDNPRQLDRVFIKKDMEEKNIANTKNIAWIATGGTIEDPTNYTHKIHRVLTQIENVSRAAFDLRKSSHLFGHPTPVWEFDWNDPTADKGAKAIIKETDGADWEPGRTYAGKAKHKYVTIPGDGVVFPKEDILNNMRFISMTLNLPIHFLSWPDLMSNRATAENLLEVITAGTKTERLLLEELYTEIIHKSMHIAVETAMEKDNIIGDFEIKIPMVSIAQLQHIASVWLPLVEKMMIRESTVRNMLPGIDPTAEEKGLEKEKKKREEKNGTDENAAEQDGPGANGEIPPRRDPDTDDD